MADRRPDDEAEARREAVLAEADQSEADPPATETPPPSDDDYVSV